MSEIGNVSTTLMFKSYPYYSRQSVHSGNRLIGYSMQDRRRLPWRAVSVYSHSLIHDFILSCRILPICIASCYTHALYMNTSYRVSYCICHALHMHVHTRICLIVSHTTFMQYLMLHKNTHTHI